MTPSGSGWEMQSNQVLPGKLHITLQVIKWWLCVRVESLFFFLRFFLIWASFKVLIEFVTILLCLKFWFCWNDLSFPTRDQTHTPCIGRWSLNPWTTRKVPVRVESNWDLRVTDFCSWTLNFPTSVLCESGLDWIQTQRAVRQEKQTRIGHALFSLWINEMSDPQAMWSEGGSKLCPSPGQVIL